MFGKLGEVLKKGIDKIASAVFIDKEMIESIVKEIQRALLEADVNVLLVKQISEKIRKTASDERLKGVEKREHLIKLLHDEIKHILGGEKHELVLEKGKNQKIILLGLYGAGKTTTIAKLSSYYQKRGYKTAILGLDVHRPAAREQLEQLGQKNNLQVFVDKQEKNPLKTYSKFQKDLEKYDLVFIDTAGRHSLDKALVSEIESLGKKIKPDYTLLVMPADIGQAARVQAQEFQKALSINGVIVTRMDSTAKGGGALTACSETQAPVFFITTGEHINDLESFNPESFISRMLGMGDLQGLLEKVQSVVDEKQQKKMKERLDSGKFTLLDLQEQLKSMESLGSLSKIKNLIPGLGNKIPDNLLGTQEDKIKKWKFAISSMTQEEIENPEIIEKQTSRIGRIAKGSGVHTSDVRALLKQYKMLKELIKGGDLSNLDASQGLSQKQMMKLAKKFKGKIRL